MSGTGTKRRRRTGRVALAAAAALAVGAGAVAATGIGLPSEDETKKEQSAVPRATAKVTRQTLVDTQSETGRLSYGDSTDVAARLAGTLTSLQTSGSVIKQGKEAYRVDNTPVVLMYGPLPTYRALTSGLEGADVKQFEQNLYELGYRGFTVDEEFTDATATAVKKWQKALGLEETGTVELGRVVYAAGPVRIDTVKASLADELKAGDTVFTYTGTVRGVSLELDLADQRLAVKDAPVSVELPDGRTVPGKIAATRTAVDEGDGSGGGAGGGGDDPEAETKIEVGVAFDDPNAAAGFDDAAVDVGFTTAKRENVLTVPVAALLTLAEGGYGVEAVEGTGTRIVAVETGMFASGRVEVTGEGLNENTTVGMPS